MNISNLHIGLAAACLRRLAYKDDVAPPRLPPSGPRWSSDGRGTLVLYDPAGARSATFRFLPPEAPTEIRIAIRRDGFASITEEAVENDEFLAIATTHPQNILAAKAAP